MSAGCDERLFVLSPKLVAALAAQPSWSDQAACKGMPTDWWFPQRHNWFETVHAKVVCAACPCKQPCLELGMALTQDEPGIYGGLTQAQRRDLRRWRRLMGAP